MRKTAEEAAQTRRELLKAALLTFQEKGWQGATFDAVAHRAGVTRGALYHHFKSKEELLCQALSWGWDEYEAVIFKDGDESKDVTEWLTNLLSNFVRPLYVDELFRALTHATVIIAPQALSFDKADKETLDSWQQKISEKLATTETSLDSETIAGLVIVILHGFTVTAATRPHHLPHPEKLDAAIRALVNGLIS